MSRWDGPPFMNSDLAVRSADAVAARLLANDRLDDAGRTRLLFALAYGRPPSERELARVRAGVAAFQTEFSADADRGRRRAWAAVCQAVLSANEFIHLN